MEFLEPHQRNARVYLQEPSSLQCAHSCEVQEGVGFITIGSTGEPSFLETHIFERFDAILFVKVCADSVPSVGIVALVNTRAFLDELPPNKH